jgi:hypothetical protein
MHQLVTPMDNLTKLPVKNYPRRYALINVQKKRKLACQLNGEWIIDATCKSINEMLEAGLVCEDSVTGWISNQVYYSH